ncbi:MAG: type II secretion system F family protein [archaeon]
MKIEKIHIAGIVSGVLIILISFFFIDSQTFYFMLGIGIIFGVFPFVFTTIQESRIANEKEEMFLEFSRNLVESVKTGTPISKSIINMKDRAYGVLSENVKKLGNQISMGIPLNTALQTFAKDVHNKTISRALTLIGQAEKAGGDIGEILESVAEAVRVSDKLKKERRAAISTLVVQGYIIFFVFMMIILVMQFKILPMVSGIADVNLVGGVNLAGAGIEQKEISGAFLYLILIQGFFSGLAIGKLAEGNVKSGIKHSFILMLMAFITSSGANLILG